MYVINLYMYSFVCTYIEREVTGSKVADTVHVRTCKSLIIQRVRADNAISTHTHTHAHTRTHTHTRVGQVHKGQDLFLKLVHHK